MGKGAKESALEKAFELYNKMHGEKESDAFVSDGVDDDDEWFHSDDCFLEQEASSCCDSDADIGNTELYCKWCEKNLPVDDFSRVQAHEADSRKRFCLRHTSSSAFGGSYRAAPYLASSVRLSSASKLATADKPTRTLNRSRKFTPSSSINGRLSTSAGKRRTETCSDFGSSTSCSVDSDYSYSTSECAIDLLSNDESESSGDNCNSARRRLILYFEESKEDPKHPRKKSDRNLYSKARLDWEYLSRVSGPFSCSNNSDAVDHQTTRQANSFVASMMSASATATKKLSSERRRNLIDDDDDENITPHHLSSVADDSSQLPRREKRRRRIVQVGEEED
jgi:hypothetical protein